MPPEETLRKFKIEDTGTLLDVGCGIGYFTIGAASILKNGNVIGLDIIDEILEVAKGRSQDTTCFCLSIFSLISLIPSIEQATIMVSKISSGK